MSATTELKEICDSQGWELGISHRPILGKERWYVELLVPGRAGYMLNSLVAAFGPSEEEAAAAVLKKVKEFDGVV